MSVSWKWRTKPMRRSRTPRSSIAAEMPRAGWARCRDRPGSWPAMRVQQQRAVGHRAGQRPDMVEREGQREHAAARHQAVGRLQPDDAAGAGRIAHRAAGVGAERHREQPGADAGAGTGGRAAGMVRRVPRIARRRERQVEARPADGELVRGELAEDDRAGLAQLARSPPRRRLATLSSRIFEWQVVGRPATSMMSLMPTGTPCSGPRTRPAAISRSAARAASIAASASRRMKACSFGSQPFDAVRAARCSSSTGESVRAAKARVASVAVSQCGVGGHSAGSRAHRRPGFGGGIGGVRDAARRCPAPVRPPPSRRRGIRPAPCPGRRRAPGRRSVPCPWQPLLPLATRRRGRCWLDEARPRGSAPWNPAKGGALRTHFVWVWEGAYRAGIKALSRPPPKPRQDGFQRLCLWWGVQGGKAPLAFLANQHRHRRRVSARMVSELVGRESAAHSAENLQRLFRGGSLTRTRR